MKTFPTNFDTEKDKKIGASPVWILKCPFASGTVYISDQMFTITGWDGGPTTKSWVNSWGQIDEDIAGQLVSPRVSDVALNVINDPDDADTIESILDNVSNSIETTDCELYLWFLGLDASTDPPQKMWVGNIVDWTKLDELIYALELVDQSVRVDKYIGTKIDKSTYPSADPDDVGKVGNIGYGTVKKVPGRAILAGALDYLDAAMTASQTTLDLVDANEFPTSGTVGIEDEEITYTGKSGNQLTGLTRGANSTTAAIHARGSVVWEVRSDFTWEAFSHPIKAFDEIYAQGHNTRLKITSICTLYTGKSGDEHPTWGGKAIAVVPSKITKSQAVDLLIQDGIDVDDAIVVVDTIAVDDTITVNDLLTVSDNIGVSQGSHGHDLNSMRQGIKRRGTGHSSGGVTDPANAYDGNLTTRATLGSNGDWIDVTFSKPSGTHYGAWIWAKAGHGGSNVRLRINGVQQSLIPSNNEWVSFYTTNTNVTSAGLVQIASGAGYLYEIEVEYDMVPSEATTNDAAAGVAKSGNAFRSGDVTKGGAASKSGSASKSGTVTKTGTVIMTGNSVADAVVADRLLVDAQCYQDDGSGTFTGTPNALIERPDHVFKHFLNTYASWAVADFYTDAGSQFSTKGYVFAGVINEYKKLKEWLRIMAFQCRCYFRFHAGQAQLLWRPDSITSDKTLTKNMIRMKEDSKTTTQVRRSPLHEVINKIEVHYDRDWTKTGEGAYKEISKASDSASSTKYGEKEKPELFFFDFVIAQAMADDVRDFYLARYKDRKKLVSKEIFLDNSELEFADGVTIAPLSNLLAEIQKVNIYPGSGRDMRNDRIVLLAREY